MIAPSCACCNSVGFNLVGFSSALFAVAPCLPGLFARLTGRLLAGGSTAPITVALSHIYDCAWFSSVVLGAACYMLLSQCVPNYQRVQATTRRKLGGSLQRPS